MIDLKDLQEEADEMLDKMSNNEKGCDDPEFDETDEDEETADDDSNSGVITSPLKAIRAHCLDCSCGQYNEVKYCPCTECALYPFRFGKSPYRKGRTYTEEQKEAVRNRMAAARANRNNQGK